MPIRIPRMNFPEFPGPAFVLALLYAFKIARNHEFHGNCFHFPREGFLGPQIEFLVEDEIDMSGSGELGRTVRARS